MYESVDAHWGARGEGATVAGSKVADRKWVFRPRDSRDAEITALSGVGIHGAGAVGPDGTRELVLQDGTRVRADRTEVVSE